MARNLLLQNTSRPVVHEAKHDVESFIWVLSYSIMRNLYKKASKRSATKEVRDQCAALRSQFRDCFGQATTKAIAHARQSGSPGLMFPEDSDIDAIVTKFMSNAVVVLFQTLQDLVHKAGDRLNPTVLTHDMLLTAVNQAITSLP